MAHNKVYGIRENKCKVEVPTKKQFDTLDEKTSSLITQLNDGRVVYIYFGTVTGTLQNGTVVFNAQHLELLPYTEQTRYAAVLPVIDNRVCTGGAIVDSDGSVSAESYSAFLAKETISETVYFSVNITGTHSRSGGYSAPHDLEKVGVLVVQYNYEYK